MYFYQLIMLFVLSPKETTQQGWRVCGLTHLLLDPAFGFFSFPVPKLDGVGPADKRPSTNKLHHFVFKNQKLWHVTCDTWHVTCDMWHVTCDMWHVTCDMWHLTCDMWHVTCDMFGGVNILSKFQLPSSYLLWFMILWRSGGKGGLNEWIN